MTKYYGKILFSISDKTESGIYEETIIDRKYKGDVEKNWRRWETGERLNDNININNTISIVADSFLLNNLGMIRAVEWMGSYWKVSSIELKRPRLILEIGGVYNGPTPGSSDDSGGDCWG